VQVFVSEGAGITKAGEISGRYIGDSLCFWQLKVEVAYFYPVTLRQVRNHA